MLMTPRQDGRTLIFFGNWSTAGAWVVAHRLNATMEATAGEVASFWHGPGSDPVWVAPVLSTVVFLHCGRPFLEGGLTEPPAGVAELLGRAKQRLTVVGRDRGAGPAAQAASRRVKVPTRTPPCE